MYGSRINHNEGHEGHKIFFVFFMAKKPVEIPTISEYLIVKKVSFAAVPGF